MIINQRGIYDLCISFINNPPNLDKAISLGQALQDRNILELNLPRGCGKTTITTKLAVEYPDTIIVPANRHMARNEYSLIPRNRIIPHSSLLEEYIRGINPCPLECRVIIIDDCEKMTPEQVLMAYIQYPHRHRSQDDLRWQAPKVIKLGTRYKL